MHESLRQLFDLILSRHIESLYPVSDRLGECVAYALSGPGKRVRPLLCMLSTKALGGDPEQALIPSLALEMIHTYSLVHDDLPCLDNDDWRRGRPTVHKKFDEQRALLVGDALLTDAFTALSSGNWSKDLRVPELSDGVKIKVIGELARGAGGRGMVWGQAMDIFWTGRPHAGVEDLDHIHCTKTGALMGAACASGAWCAEGSPETALRFRRFGVLLGHAYQVKDDLLDDQMGTGKSAGKDLAAGKLTYLQVMTRGQAEAKAKELTDQAIAQVEGLGKDTEILVGYAVTLLRREY